jgi:hypothetical protein
MITIEEGFRIIQKLLACGLETNTGRLRFFRLPAVGLSQKGPENRGADH